MLLCSSVCRFHSTEKKHRFEQQAKRLQQYRKVVAKEEKAVEELDATVSRRRQFYDEVFADNNNISRLKPVRLVTCCFFFMLCILTCLV